ncbi:MAG: ribonuclease P protein component [Candidatus Mcinerneyibacterium aminivorans]|uniref:Ribonuclease P protein component n=1 Tax=Candidatus Mcinerneyibacterium aminivorans TaxID=2703815 RepID=A0A5D0MDP5_9BACT|nr:MAG: ribonuclease P protein component [Candidatus Mcinerneyibacterium aminivorans]
MQIEKKKSFDSVFKYGKKHKSEYFTIYFKKETDLKIGIVISKKVGNAVLRNYVKRIIRELFRKTKDKFEDNMHMIIIPSKKYNWDKLQFKRVKKSWMESISKINQINNELC